MKARHVLWDAASSGNSVRADTPEELKALYHYNVVILAERFGWTEEYISSLEIDLYEDILSITSLIDFKRSQKK